MMMQTQTSTGTTSSLLVKLRSAREASIKGQTYLFDNEGRMQTGWVALTASTSSNAKEYLEIGGEDSTS